MIILILNEFHKKQFIIKQILNLVMNNNIKYLKKILIEKMKSVMIPNAFPIFSSFVPHLYILYKPKMGTSSKYLY